MKVLACEEFRSTTATSWTCQDDGFPHVDRDAKANVLYHSHRELHIPYHSL